MYARGRRAGVFLWGTTSGGVTGDARRMSEATDVGGRREVAVSTRKLTKKYGEHLAVDGVSLTVRRGEVYGFLGPNEIGRASCRERV